ncbi:TetR/AcrR family transcriptional regulator [Campylobacter concisus]|jgi:SNF7 family protein|uniref:TetR/AcrR family transcriptional regulator n=1 Tax=Campylobacter concisus TaxID=199 RepID=UPI0018848441|nr:TetR/AcrR family transcriptional regulator [Campylobacter concisus]MBE9870648.1 TetR/AcrR family transcriptional regulator [Campylobacter concisus]
MEKKEIANLLDIELRTLYNWEKSRPKLYNFIIENIEDKQENTSKTDELKKYFEKLSEIEQEYFLSSLKVKVLEKEIKQTETYK